MPPINRMHAPLAPQLNERLSFGQHKVWKRMAVRWTGAKAGNRVLDVCCGSGDLAFELARAVGPSGQVGSRAGRQRTAPATACKLQHPTCHLHAMLRCLPKGAPAGGASSTRRIRWPGRRGVTGARPFGRR